MIQGGDSQISINKEALADVIRKLTVFKEETEEYLKALDRSIANAEADGWNDIHFHEFYDTYIDFGTVIKNELKKIEEDHLPKLRRLERAAEEFMQG